MSKHNSKPKKSQRKSAYIQTFSSRLKNIVVPEHLNFLEFMNCVLDADNTMKTLLNNDIRLRYQPIDEKIYALIALQESINRELSNKESSKTLTDSDLLEVGDGWDLRRNTPGIPSVDFCQRFFSVFEDRKEEVLRIMDQEMV